MTTSFKLTYDNVNSSQSLLDNKASKNNETPNSSNINLPVTSTSKLIKSKMPHRLLGNQVTDCNYRSSTSSINSSVKMSSVSMDDDDERFYDAIDAAENSNVFSPSSSSVTSKKKAYSFGNDDDDEDDTSCFFDTKTSRHASELSDCSVVGSLPNFRNKHSIVFDDKDVVEESHASKIISNTNDEDDEFDVELETEWSFWVDRSTRGATKDEYEAGIKLIHSFKTVQSFWSIFNNIPDISSLPNNFSYHLMRNTQNKVRRPLWEDSENRRGGQWKLKCRKEETSAVWLELVLAGIGEQFSDCVSPMDDIVGLTVGKRDKDDIIQIWNADHNYHKNARVCDKLQELVPNIKFSVIFYKAHALHEAFDNSSQLSTSPHTSNISSYQKNNSNFNNSNQHQYVNHNSSKNINKFNK